MSKTPEGKVKEAVKKVLNTYGAYYFMPIGTMYSKIGVPDIVACIRGKFVGIECKAGNNRATELQLRNLEAIRDNGGHAWVVNENDLETLEKNLDLV